MSAKPSTIPNWAGSATGISRTVDPAGAAADGFAVSARPPAGWVNFLLHHLSLWAQYLSDQAFDGNVSIVGGGGLTVDDGIDAGGIIEATGNINSNASVTAVGHVSAGTYVQTAEADIRHGSRTVQLATSDFHPIGSNSAYPFSLSADAAWQETSGAEQFYCPLHLQVGETLASVSAYVKRPSSTINMGVFKSVYGTVTALGSHAFSSGTADQSFTISGLAEVVAAGTSYWISLDCLATGQRVYGGDFTTTR